MQQDGQSSSISHAIQADFCCVSILLAEGDMQLDLLAVSFRTLQTIMLLHWVTKRPTISCYLNRKQAVKKIWLQNLFTRSLPIRIMLVEPIVILQWLFYDTIKIIQDEYVSRVDHKV